MSKPIMTDLNGRKYNAMLDIKAEIVRQNDKWGPQLHPSFQQTLLNRPGGCTPDRMADEYGLPHMTPAKLQCNTSFSQGTGTWCHIFAEEVSEVVDAFQDPDKLYEELMQVAAVCTSWMAQISLERKYDGPKTT